ncbi:MAG: hypothetical protein GX605_01640 [Chloroflexi bacterium]|nr:hypothetical protein [Chloroflexota bacterium]
MAQLVVLILDDVGQCFDVMSAWREAGASGVTVLQSTGLQRLRSAMREDMPLFPSLRDLVGNSEYYHRTIFTVVPEDATVERIIAATEKVIGDLNEEHTGILFVAPLTRVVGLQKRRRGSA